jgi:hypothetical protein
MRGSHEAAQQSQQGRLAGSIVADDGDALALGGTELVDVEQGAALRDTSHGLQGDDGRGRGGAHSRARRMRRLMASKEATRNTTTISTVASRPH